jgi:hypothetical protein
VLCARVFSKFKPSNQYQQSYSPASDIQTYANSNEAVLKFSEYI